MGILRLLLAVAVVVQHSGPIFGIRLVDGRIAVEAFFVISGFYMAMVLSGKYAYGRRGLWKTFLAARFSRLMPLYYIIAALSLFLVLLGGNIYIGDDAQAFPYSADLDITSLIVLGISHLLLFGQDVLMFTGINPEGALAWERTIAGAATPTYELMLLPQAWTVGLEMVFYCIAPLLIRRSSRFLVAILCCSVILRAVLLVSGLSEDPWTYRFFPTELAFFLMGILAYRSRRFLLTNRVTGNSMVSVVVIAAIPLLQLVVFPASSHLLPLIYCVMVAVALPKLFSRSRNNRVDRWIGELSYPLYLVHILVISLMPTGELRLNGLVCVVASLAAAVILTLAIDRPIESRRQREIAKRTAPEVLYA